MFEGWFGASKVVLGVLLGFFFLVLREFTRVGVYLYRKASNSMGNSGSSSSSSSSRHDRRASLRYDQPPSSRYDHPPSSRYDQPPSSQYDQPPSYGYEQQQYSYTPSLPPPAQTLKPVKKTFTRRFSQKYSLIGDNYTSVEEVQRALSQAGLESSNLIVGIDFTKSNEWTGKKSFNGRSLHAVGEELNPYEKAISIVGETLSPFDDDNLIPCFGFGDSSSHDNQVFSFFPDHRPCDGFEEALRRYRAIVPHLRLAGPTSFAPIINAAVEIVEQSGGQYHVLIIIADGQVTRSIDTADGHQSPQERATVEAIVNASSYPLSIVLVGVGDGPWDMMLEFDDNLPARRFDNFQFVNFTQIMQRSLPQHQREAQFALAALMEIPQQYKATLELGILGTQTGNMPGTKPLPPPPGVMRADGHSSGGRMLPVPSHTFSHSQTFPPSGPETPTRPASSHYIPPPINPYASDYGYNYGYPPLGPASNTFAPAYDDRSSTRASPPVESGGVDCPVCLMDKKDMAFNCGHQTCRQCGASLANCPICRKEITTRIRLY